jgi:hypothetical protein
VTIFNAETYQNEYLPVAGTEVNAVVRVTASGSGTSGNVSGEAAEIILVDVSGSMNYPRSKIRSARDATSAAIDCIRDGVHFGVVAGTDTAREIYPGNGELATASDTTRKAAKNAVNGLKAGGGTAIGQWLSCATDLFSVYPGAIHHAILLTDGQNQDESAEELDAVLAACQGRFQCDCRGVGADWEVAELREIASSLLGDVGLIREPEQMTTDFTEMMQRAMGRAVNDGALRVWTPQGATVDFVKQVAPSIEDLTARRTDVNDLTGDYPTGAWGDEARDYHVRVTVPAREVGEEMLAARVHLVVDGEVLSEAKVRALWTEDEVLSTRLNPEVVRSSGDGEYAAAVQEGVAAIREGDSETATNRLGRAWHIAEAMGDQEKLAELRPIVDVDEATGKIRPKGGANELDLKEADMGSTKTVRTPKKPDS